MVGFQLTAGFAVTVDARQFLCSERPRAWDERAAARCL